MPRKPIEWRRVCTIAADFQVSEHGKVKLTDPPNHRIRYFDASGHKAFTLCGKPYFVAELVAIAHLDSKTGFIDYQDGDPQNCSADNLVITHEEPTISPQLLQPDNLPQRRITVHH